MDADVTARFFEPFSQTLNTTIAAAMQARKHVQSTRLNYDASKQRLKGAASNRADALRQELELAEDQFVAAVEDAMNKMKAVVSSPAPLANLADLVAAQLAFHKEAYEALAELSPEIDELQITNEAITKADAVA